MMCSSSDLELEGGGGGGQNQHPSLSSSSSCPPHPYILFWRQRIQEWYPRWRERTYFIPPVLMCKTLCDTVDICGQSVQIPLPPVTGPTRKSQISLLASDVTEDQTQQRILHCFHKLALAQKDVMFVLSQLRYEDYLNEPSFEAAARTLPRPVDLEKEGKHRGDFDVLIIHRLYGILFCEIKSVGAQFSTQSFTEQQQENIVVGRLVNAVKQLRKSEDVLRHLLSDRPQPPRVRASLILPNVSAEQLRNILRKHPDVSRDLCHCLGVGAHRDPVDFCLTSDRVSDVATPYDVNADVIQQLRQWWQVRMSCEGPDSNMSDSAYLDLLARFSGPATTVRVFCCLKPRLHMDLVRTEGEGVAETGHRFSQIMLTPHQLALQNTPEPLVMLTGPPGTGKSLMLVLKALDWLRQGQHVHVLSTWNQSLAMSYSIVHQLEKTLGPAVAGGRVHLHELDLLRGRAEVDRGVRMLLGEVEKSQGRPLYLVVDEAYDGLGSQFTDLCQALQTLLPPGYLHLWAACVHHDRHPSLLMEVPLTQPLRSPPSVTREVQLSSSLLSGTVYNYTPSVCPLPADGPPTIRLQHSGKGHGHATEIRHCVQCGRDVAALLLRDLQVGVTVPGRPCRCCQTPLQFRDVFLLSYYALNEANGIIQGLQQCGVPVTVMKSGDSITTARVARAELDQVVAAHLSFVSGLERKVVIWLQGDRSEEAGLRQEYDEQYSRLYAMSRCTAQLVCVMLPAVDNCSSQTS